jgi:hypothetical protein
MFPVISFVARVIDGRPLGLTPTSPVILLPVSPVIDVVAIRAKELALPRTGSDWPVVKVQTLGFASSLPARSFA